MAETQNLIVVMGVSGCGKSSVGKALADHLSYQFVEADDFHPQSNKDHMANGYALDDTMREPWIALLQARLKQLAESKHNCVMSFSGLRRSHRSKIQALPFNSVFIHLEGEQQLIADRINARSDHFMPASLLDSQYLTLEAPSENDTIININIEPPLESVIANAIAIAKHHLEK